MTNAAITPGTQPQIHNIKVIRKEPQPLSITAIGGQKIEIITRQILISCFLIDDFRAFMVKSYRTYLDFTMAISPIQLSNQKIT